MKFLLIIDIIQGIINYINNCTTIIFKSTFITGIMGIVLGGMITYFFSKKNQKTLLKQNILLTRYDEYINLVKKFQDDVEIVGCINYQHYIENIEEAQRFMKTEDLKLKMKELHETTKKIYNFFENNKNIIIYIGGDMEKLKEVYIFFRDSSIGIQQIIKLICEFEPKGSNAQAQNFIRNYKNSITVFQETLKDFLNKFQDVVYNKLF